jgi:hypothetical protein
MLPMGPSYKYVAFVVSNLQVQVVGIRSKKNKKKKGTESNNCKNIDDHSNISNVRIVPNCKVNRIITTPTTSMIDHDVHHYTNANTAAATTTPPCRATGVECYAGQSSTPIQFKARRGVILAAGALQSLCILQRSKFTYVWTTFTITSCRWGIWFYQIATSTPHFVIFIIFVIHHVNIIRCYRYCYFGQQEQFPERRSDC